MTSTITSKGQVTIPKPVRDRLKLHPGDTIDFIIEADGHIRIAVVAESIRKLKGMAPRPKKVVSLEQMQDAIEKNRASS